MSNIYHTNIEEIHSFDSRYKNIVFRNNNIIIPYINLGVSKHPLHPSDKGMTFIDFSYMIFIDVNFLKVYINKPYIVIDAGKESEHFYFGGDYWDYERKIFNDMEIGCSNAFLQTLGTTQLSNTMWMPFDAPNFPKNMNLETVESFFSHDFMPINIKELIDY